jgi:hypothetical protein
MPANRKDREGQERQKVSIAEFQKNEVLSEN